MQLPSRLPNVSKSPNGRVWSAKLIVQVPSSSRRFVNANAYTSNSRPGLQALQRHLMIRYLAHNREYTGSTPVAATKCTDGVMAALGSPKPLVRVSPTETLREQILVCALPCPNRKSLHTHLTVRQLSLKQSMQVQFLCVNQQLFSLTRHTWCRSEVVERHVFQACN